jgi:hypothetical protein
MSSLLNPDSVIKEKRGGLPPCPNFFLLFIPELDFKTFYEPRNRFQGIDSASCRTGPPGYIGWRNRFLGSLKVEKIWALFFFTLKTTLWRWLLLVELLSFSH